ncbi:Glutathione S-transferase kappa 1 [Serendipita sp. 396]|nr:Glutathione S-transferase kappa 1 [Serendipita sp. 396]KAG8787147.1 Glutathione S-transferase kappa 1 [Serendipita sp. 397]KAG8802672.1 Glutathione S-transferase kappa 1 [Serendipita sp. 398]KAG8825559.1 Glutathione S-transferase kappa 1 [Serendipita sp. 401]KAG8835920.1 Glutathione S-transferase kappa 1 [Serendipita sp. 400]KAG8860766.1 Glutathione S-transferase kappa 1 [Serendipita sp. 411]KAG9054054.1 Glutathione S-transferase kappa 1 [Serendipita sp. 407]
MPPPIRISFFYDIGSPYTYFAFQIIQRYERIWNIDLELHPTLLGAVFKTTGGVSPAQASPYKAGFMLKDLERVSQEYQVPFSVGPEFPGNTLQPMRMLRYLKDELSPTKFREATAHYFQENFVKNTPLSSPEFVTSLPPSILSQDEMKVALSKSKSVTEKMKAEVEALVNEHQAFGFPWIVVKRDDGQVESWFGSDRFSNIAWWLGPEYPWLGPVPPKPNL